MTIRFRTTTTDRALTQENDVFPGRNAPVIRMVGDGVFMQENMQWGFPPFKGTRPVCHVANTTSPYWRPWLSATWRCAVPASAFSEYSSVDNTSHWFGASAGDVLWLAALWRPLSGKRVFPLPPADVDPRVFALLNAPPNSVIAAHHPGSMPTVLRRAELETWLLAPKEIALELRRPFNADLLRRLN